MARQAESGGLMLSGMKKNDSADVWLAVDPKGFDGGELLGVQHISRPLSVHVEIVCPDAQHRPAFGSSELSRCL